jgi:long-chain fatty acid transport protein
VNNPAERLPDGRMKFKADDWGFGGNAGVLLEPNAHLRFGLAYRSQVDMSYTDQIKFTNLGPGLRRILQRVGVVGGETTLDQTNPQTVMASWYYALTDRSALMGNFGWQNWEAFGHIGTTIHGGTTIDNTVSLHFNDTYHFAVGAQYRVAPAWLVSAGFAHDTSPVAQGRRQVREFGPREAGGARQQRFRKDRIVLPNRFVIGQIAIANHRADSH